MNHHCNTYAIMILIRLGLALSLLTPLSAQGDDKVRLQLKWQHQFQFAGYYAAQEQGYYRNAGLEVEILPAQPGEDPVRQVVRGKAEFGVGSTELILLREQGAPVVTLAVIFQHSPLALMALKKDGIQTIHDLAGHKVMIESGSAELHAYLRNEGISSDKFTLLPHSFGVQELLAGKVDAISVYVTDEPFDLKKARRDYQLYSPRAVGIDFYGDNLFTTEELLRKKPEVVRKFREASLRGWDYAMQHQEEMARLIYDRYSKRHSLEHLRFEARQMEPLLQTSLIEVGHMNPGRWRNIAEVYAGMGMLKRDFDLKGFLYDPKLKDLSWLYRALATAVVLLLGAVVTAVRFVRLSTALRKSNAKREKTEAALREKEEKYRILFMDSPDAYLIISDGVFVDCNRAAEVMLRAGRMEINGLAPDRISPEFQPDGKKSSEAAQEKFDLALRSGSITFEWVHRRLDGTDFFVEVSVAMICLDGKDAFFVTWRDITERKRAETEVIHNNARLQLLVDILQHSAGTIQELLDYALEQALRLTGSKLGYIYHYDEERMEFVLNTWSIEVLPECAVANPQTCYELGKTGIWGEAVRQRRPIVVNDFQAANPLKKGYPEGHVHLSKFLTLPVFRGSRIVGVVGVANKETDYEETDILQISLLMEAVWSVTERKQAEDALRETNDYLENLITYANAPIIVWDPRFRITRFNHAFESLTGRAEAEVVGESLEILFPPRLADSSMALIRQTATGERWESVEIEIQHRDGAVRTVLWNSATLFAPDGRTPVAVIAQGQDITERKRAEAESARARDAAEAATSAKSEFLANMSHEIRTPMNAIIGLSHLALRTALEPKQQDYLTKIKRSAQSLMGIINDILDFSKIEAGKMTLENIEFNLFSVLESMSDFTALLAAEKGIELRYAVPPDIPVMLRGDPLRLGQVLLNLVSNAVKFTEAGEVEVAVTVVERRRDEVILSFEVRDSGIGMTEEQMTRLFESFSQADMSTTRRFGGTGLGLAISNRLAHLMGGSISVASVLGKGTTVTFAVRFGLQETLSEPSGLAGMPSNHMGLFGAGDRSSAAGEGRDGAELLADAAGARVLVAEDNRINRQVAEELLAGFGLVVDVVDNGCSAVEAVRLQPTAYAAILMDIQMPEMDGLAATRKIRELPGVAPLPIIAMTAHAMPTERQRCLESGMDDHLAKPIDPQQLLGILNRWIKPAPVIAPVPVTPPVLPVAAVEAVLPDTLPPFDIAAALVRINGKRSLLKQLLLAFAEDHARSVTELRRLIADSQFGVAGRLAHTLRGVAGNLEAHDLGEAARDLEQLCTDGGGHDYGQALDCLERHLTAALAAVSALK